jgi:hypothetical protein
VYRSNKVFNATSSGFGLLRWFWSGSKAKPVRIVGEWWLAIGATELLDQFCLNLNRDAPRGLFPRDEQAVDTGQLPNQAAAPMPDRLACSEVCKLPGAALQLICLTDIDDLRTIDPISRQSLERLCL